MLKKNKKIKGSYSISYIFQISPFLQKHLLFLK